MGRLENIHDYYDQILIFNNYFQLIFKVKIDGVEIENEENRNPQSFKDVKVFMGDNFHTATDATYSNLMWENIGEQGENKFSKFNGKQWEQEILEKGKPISIITIQT